MATNKTQYLQLNEWTADDRFKLSEVNENFRKIDEELQTQADALNSHITSTSAHNAEDITYQNTNIKQALDDLDDRIDNIVVQAGNSNAEIVDARHDSVNNVTHPTLKDRLDSDANNIKTLTDKVGDLTALKTTSKNSVVEAVNEHDDKIGILLKNAISILSYGAKAGDPNFDNIPVIQSAIDAAYNNGGGAVIIPYGVFYVAPTMTQKISMKSDVSLISFGGVLKVKDNAGDFYRLINADNTSNVTFYGITFDMNGQNNATANVSMTGGRPHAVINAWNADQMTVENCRFLNCIGVTVIQNDGQHTGHYTRIKNNYIHWLRSPSTGMWYDNTCIRVINSYYSEVKGNHIVCNNLSDKAECAIDVRSYGCIVEGNTSKNFTNFMDIVAAESTSDHPSGLIVRNNVVYNAESAINLWNNAGNGLRDVTIQSNTIHVNQLTRNAANAHGIYCIELTTSNVMENIKVLNNTIIFETGDTRTSGVYTAGIAFVSNYQIKGLQIIGNTVKDSPQFGLVVGSTASSSVKTYYNVDVLNNHFINCQRTFGSNVISFGGDLKNTIIKDNIIYDDGSTPYAKLAWDSYVATDYSGIKILDNKIVCINGKIGKSPVPFFSSSIASMYGLSRQVYAQFDTSTYRNVLANDIVVMNDGIYKVTLYGTYGTLSGVAGTGSAGSKDLTVNDATNINPWDKINIGGILETYVVSVKGNVVRLNDALPSNVTNATVQRVAPSTTKLTVT